MSSAPRLVDGPNLPHLPSLSAIAETVITLGWLAGEKVAAFLLLFPAATTYITPALTELLIAVLSEVDVHSHPRLILATSIQGA